MNFTVSDAFLRATFSTIRPSYITHRNVCMLSQSDNRKRQLREMECFQQACRVCVGRLTCIPRSKTKTSTEVPLKITGKQVGVFYIRRACMYIAVNAAPLNRRCADDAQFFPSFSACDLSPLMYRLTYYRIIAFLSRRKFTLKTIEKHPREVKPPRKAKVIPFSIGCEAVSDRKFPAATWHWYYRGLCCHCHLPL